MKTSIHIILILLVYQCFAMINKDNQMNERDRMNRKRRIMSDFDASHRSRQVSFNSGPSMSSLTDSGPDGNAPKRQRTTPETLNLFPGLAGDIKKGTVNPNSDSIDSTVNTDLKLSWTDTQNPQIQSTSNQVEYENVKNIFEPNDIDLTLSLIHSRSSKGQKFFFNMISIMMRSKNSDEALSRIQKLVNGFLSNNFRCQELKIPNQRAVFVCKTLRFKFYAASNLKNDILSARFQIVDQEKNGINHGFEATMRNVRNSGKVPVSLRMVY